MLNIILLILSISHVQSSIAQLKNVDILHEKKQIKETHKCEWHGVNSCVESQLYWVSGVNRHRNWIRIGSPWRGHIFTSPSLCISTRNLHIYEQIPVFVGRLRGTRPSCLYMYVRVLSTSARLVKRLSSLLLARITRQFHCSHTYTFNCIRLDRAVKAG